MWKINVFSGNVLMLTQEKTRSLGSFSRSRSWAQCTQSRRCRTMDYYRGINSFWSGICFRKKRILPKRAPPLWGCHWDPLLPTPNSGTQLCRQLFKRCFFVCKRTHSSSIYHHRWKHFRIWNEDSTTDKIIVSLCIFHRHLNWDNLKTNVVDQKVIENTIRNVFV